MDQYYAQQQYYAQGAGQYGSNPEGGHANADHQQQYADFYGQQYYAGYYYGQQQ